MIPTSGNLSAEPQTSDVKAGLQLLASAAHWWDIHNNIPSTSTPAFTSDLTNAAWSKVNVTVAGGIADPFGGTTAYRVTASASGICYVQLPGGSSMEAGYASLSGYVRYLQAAPNSGTFTIDTTVSPAGSSRLTVLKPASETGAENIPYLDPAAGASKCVGWQFEPAAGSEWRKFTISSIVRNDGGAVNATNIGRMRCDATAAGDLFEVAGLTFQHKRISSLAGRAGAVALSQATAASRQTVAYGAWLGRDAAIAAPRSAQVLSATLTSAITDSSFCVYGTVCPTRVEGYLSGNPDPVFTLTGAGSTSIALTAVQSAVGNDYQGAWGYSFTNTAGTIVSGTFAGTHLPPVPVAVALSYNQSTKILTLYVDGVSVGTADVSAAATFSATTFNVLGREAQMLWASWAIAGLPTADQARQVSLALRNAAGLPAAWRLVHWSGQSNSTASGGIAVSDTRQAGFAVGNAFFRWEEEGASYAPWTPAPSTRYWTSPAGITANYWGSAQTFLEQARQNGEFGLCIIATGKGGTGIDAWMPESASHPMYDETRIGWGAALTLFGTHLVRRDKTVWIHGEADATNGTLYPGGYSAALGNLVYTDNTDFKGPRDALLLRLSKYFSGADPTAIRTAQDTFVAGAPSDHRIVSADFVDSTPGVTLYDGIHFSTRGERKMGEFLYAKHARKAPAPSEYSSCRMFFSGETITRNGSNVTDWKSPVNGYALGPSGTVTFVKGWRNDRDAISGIVDSSAPSCTPSAAYGPLTFLFVGTIPTGTSSGQYYGISGNFSPDKCYPALVYDTGTDIQIGWAPRDGQFIVFSSFPKSAAGSQFSLVYRSQTGDHWGVTRVNGVTYSNAPSAGSGYTATSGLSMLSLGRFYAGGNPWGTPTACFAAFNEGLTNEQLLALTDWCIWYYAL